MNSFEMGVEVKDQITGIVGYVTGKSTFITGCDQYLVQPVKEDDTTEVKSAKWFDCNRLEETGGKQIKLNITPEDKENGCDASAPMK